MNLLAISHWSKLSLLASRTALWAGLTLNMISLLHFPKYSELQLVLACLFRAQRLVRWVQLNSSGKTLLKISQKREHTFSWLSSEIYQIFIYYFKFNFSLRCAVSSCIARFSDSTAKKSCMRFENRDYCLLTRRHSGQVFLNQIKIGSVEEGKSHHLVHCFRWGQLELMMNYRLDQ